MSLVCGAVTTSCRRAAATICPRPSAPRGPRSALRSRADGNVAAVSHAHRCRRLMRQNRQWSWPLTFWSCKWCPSHVWRGLPLCQFWSSYMGLGVHDLGPMYATHRQTDVRQKHRLMPPPRGRGIISKYQYHITYLSRLRNDLYCVEWDVKL